MTSHDAFDIIWTSRGDESRVERLRNIQAKVALDKEAHHERNIVKTRAERRAVHVQDWLERKAVQDARIASWMTPDPDPLAVKTLPEQYEDAVEDAERAELQAEYDAHRARDERPLARVGSAAETGLGGFGDLDATDRGGGRS